MGECKHKIRLPKRIISLLGAQDVELVRLGVSVMKTLINEDDWAETLKRHLHNVKYREDGSDVVFGYSAFEFLIDHDKKEIKIFDRPKWSLPLYLVLDPTKTLKFQP